MKSIILRCQCRQANRDADMVGMHFDARVKILQRDILTCSNLLQQRIHRGVQSLNAILYLAPILNARHVMGNTSVTQGVAQPFERHLG